MTIRLRLAARVSGGVLAAGAALLPLCRAADAPPAAIPPLFKPSISRVAVFKNGYAFTFRDGAVTPQNGWVATTDVPASVLGTLWGYSLNPHTTVAELDASETEEAGTRPVASLEELLLQNEGANVRITTTDKDKIEGALQILTARPQQPDDGVITADNPALANAVNGNYPAGFQVVLRGEHGLDVVDLAKIAHVEVLGAAPKWNMPSKIKRRLLSMRLDGAPEGETAHVGVAALEKGIRWIPGYRVELQGDKQKQAHIELEASVVNDLADVKDAEFYFVVGVPHFLMDDTLSPLSLRTAFTGLSSFFNEGQGSPYARAAMSQQVFSNSASMEGSSGAATGPNIAASAIEDSLPALTAQQLFLYQAAHLSLKKGDRASLRLFSATVPATEVYEWTILDSTPAAPRGYGVQPSSTGDLTPLSDRIWYALKLKNNSSMPWTTGPATSFSDWKPMGQDLMPFTAVGGSAILKVTPATEIVGEHAQDEKKRQREATRFNGDSYDLVTVEGTIKLRNTKKDNAVVCITRKTDGEIVTASDAGKIAREGLELQAVNPHSVITWEVTVPPGDKDLHYTYTRYVRS